MYDVQYVEDAPWVGIPFGAWPGLDFTPGIEFWALLPAFILVTLVGAIETIGEGVAIQRVSRRRPQATDYRVVQGALNTDGIGNLLSGLAGTLPNTTYSTSISLAEVTGIAARRVGIVVGVIFIVLAFFPKATALLIAIPAPVARLRWRPDRSVIRAGHANHHPGRTRPPQGHRRRRLLLGRRRVPERRDLPQPASATVLLGNGMTAGAIVAVAMMAFIEFSKPRRRRLRIVMDDDASQGVDEFLRGFASRIRWNAESADRLAAAGEETLAILSQEDPDDLP